MNHFQEYVQSKVCSEQSIGGHIRQVKFVKDSIWSDLVFHTFYLVHLLLNTLSHMTFLIEEILENQTYKMRFKWWFQFTSSTGYLDEFDLYLGWKKDVEVNLGESVVMQLSEKLKGTYCTLFSGNFFLTA